jgi:arylsulfatase A
MSLRRWACLTVALLASAGSVPATAQGRRDAPANMQSSPRRPNIVLIMADDLGYGDLGSYGSRTIATPAIDRLARQGVRFTQFYSGAPNCSPSRAALLTGRYPVRSGVNDVLFPDSIAGLPPAEVTIAEALDQVGYVSGVFGKWHLGHHHRYLPAAQGFASDLIGPYSNDMLNYAILSGDDVIEQDPAQDRLTQRFTDAAIDFVERNRERPFFLYLPYSAPHVPLYPAKEFAGRSKAGRYGDVVQEMDAHVGRLMKRLDELGLAENTMVVFTSDNGPWIDMGADGGSAGPLRGAKHSTFEGGMRVPAIVRWPGHVAAGRTYTGFASALDLYPTIVRMAGAKLPDVPLDGTDITNVLEGTGERAGPVRFGYFLGGELGAYRDGDWKLKLKWQGREPVLLQLKWPGGMPPHDDLLFNLRTDQGETRSLAESDAKRLAEMKAASGAFMTGLGPLPASVEKPRVQDRSQVLERNDLLRARARAMGLPESIVPLP